MAVAEAEAVGTHKQTQLQDKLLLISKELDKKWRMQTKILREK